MESGLDKCFPLLTMAIPTFNRSNILNDALCILIPQIEKYGNQVELNIIEGKEEYSSLGRIVFEFDENQIVTKTKIPGKTLDSLVADNNLNPGLLIVDVEGAVFKVLSGSIGVLKKYRPIIISEIVDEY
jgi:FkbM family methyltransferase